MTDLMDETSVAAAVVVARVPVVDRSRVIVGFELVNRSTEDQTTPPEADLGESVVTVSGLLGAGDVNLSAVVGHHLLFCPVDRTVLVGEAQLSLPPRRTVLEVSTAHVDDELLESLRGHKQAGFTVMVEHEEWTEETEALLALADLVKIDLRTAEPGDVMDLVEGYRRGTVDLMAAGCDTAAELAWAQAVGFDLYVGRAVQARETTRASASAPLPLSQVQLGIELLSQDLDLDRVEDVLRGDPALVLQLLNMASMGAGGGLRRQVRSLREALVVMGTARIRQWAALVILSRHGQLETDALVTTLVRARMCELLARSGGIDGPFAFTAGLLSSLHVLLGVPVEDIEEQIEVDEDLIHAAFRREGVVGDLITRIEDHEQSLASGRQFGGDQLTLIAAMAFGWAASYADAMDSAVQAS